MSHLVLTAQHSPKGSKIPKCAEGCPYPFLARKRYHTMIRDYVLLEGICPLCECWVSLWLSSNELKTDYGYWESLGV